MRNRFLLSAGMLGIFLTAAGIPAYASQADNPIRVRAPQMAVHNGGENRQNRGTRTRNNQRSNDHNANNSRRGNRGGSRGDGERNRNRDHNSRGDGGHNNQQAGNNHRGNRGDGNRNHNARGNGGQNNQHAGNTHRGNRRDGNRNRNRNRDHNARGDGGQNNQHAGNTHRGNRRNGNRNHNTRRGGHNDHRYGNNHNRGNHRITNRNHRNSARHNNRNQRRHTNNRHRSHRHNSNSSFALYLGGFGYSRYGNRYGYPYYSSYDLFPWWYGGNYGYRNRTGYLSGYGHIGHSNIYCTDPYHQSYNSNWGRNDYRDDQFAYSEYTDGGYGGGDVRDCHRETQRGVYGRRSAIVSTMVCFNSTTKNYEETGAQTLVRYVY